MGFEGLGLRTLDLGRGAQRKVHNIMFSVNSVRVEFLEISLQTRLCPCEPDFSPASSSEPGLWLAGNEGMGKKMETTIMSYIGITIRIHADIPS